MPHLSRLYLLFSFLLIILAACGGGSSGNAPIAPVDPAPAYKGVRSQAAVGEGNAETLALNAFAASDIAAGTGFNGSAKSTSAAAVEQDRRLRRLTLALKESTQRMELPRVAKERLKALTPEAKQTARRAKQAAREVASEFAGPDGGSASFTLNVNDSTGSFYGTVTYHAYTSGSIVLSGTADMMGTFDLNYGRFSRITLSFKSLSLSLKRAPVTLIGSISWAFNPAAGTDEETLNLVLAEGADTYWWNNYQVSTTYGDTTRTRRVLGRFYHCEYGYVDVSTDSPLVGGSDLGYPAQGRVKFSGRGGTCARLNFAPRNFTVEADSDGNGSADWIREFPSNPQSSINSEPVADAGVDQQVIQAAPVSLDGSASHDPDGDSLSYLWEFSYCPDGACPTITGNDSATPSFTPNRVGTYNLRLTVSDGVSLGSDVVAVTASAATPSDPGLLQLRWQYGTFGTRIGSAGLITKDLNGDRVPEIVASASPGGYGGNTFWYVLRRGADGSYGQFWRSEIYSEPMVRLALADLTADGKADIVVILSDGSILAYDTATLQQKKALKVPGTLTAAAIADVDGDGKNEILTSDGIAVQVYAADGSLKWSLDHGGGTSLAVGNVDGDPSCEIVTTGNGGKGYVIDAATRTVQWEYLNGFGAQVALSDLDGDGRAEIVGAAAWRNITVFDAGRKTPVWDVTTEQDIAALRVEDADGDGVPEILYGDGQWGKVHAIDARTHLDKWAVRNPGHGVAGLALDDLNLDGSMELLWGNSSLHIADPGSGTLNWCSEGFGGMRPVAVGDLDGDGSDDVVTVTPDDDSSYPVIKVYDAGTHLLKYQAKQTVFPSTWSFNLGVADLDGDGKAELVVTTNEFGDGVIQVYDGATLQLKGESARRPIALYYGLVLADVDLDGREEIVSSEGGRIVVFDTALQEKWRSVQMGSLVYDVKVADFDGDGHPDIAASGANGSLAVYDGVSHDLKAVAAVPGRALAVADVDGDGRSELLVGRDDGIIDIFDGRTLAKSRSVDSLSASSVDALQVIDLTGAGSGELLIGSGSNLTILSKGGGLLWRRILADYMGVGNHLAVSDSDRDGHPDLFVGSDLSLSRFEAR